MTSELESTSLGDSDEDDTMSRCGTQPCTSQRHRVERCNDKN